MPDVVRSRWISRESCPVRKHTYSNNFISNLRSLYSIIKYEGRELYRDQKYVSKYWTENERGHVRYMYMYIHIFNEFNLKNNLKEYRKGMGVVVLRNPRTHTIDHNISFSAKGPTERYKKEQKDMIDLKFQ